MKILKLIVKNYRNLENCEINFPDFYTALSGKNNSGKSNVLRAIRLFFRDDDDFDPFSIEVQTINIKSDYPIWKQKDETRKPIYIELTLLVDKNSDAGLFKFIDTFLSLCCSEDTINIVLGREYSEEKPEGKLSLNCNGIEPEDHFKISEIHKKIRSSNSLYFHNSIVPRHRYYTQHAFASFFGNISSDDQERINNASNTLFSRLKTVAKKHKNEIVELLGRLDEKYEVSIGIPKLNIERMPFSISLGDKKAGVPLEEWGSGTQNRTMILLALLRAKKSLEASSESDRITPIIIIEEPESFLHPSAQAEFGKILRDLSLEFNVQVITTTHSPYMLSVEKPDSNILLSRKVLKDQLLETLVVDTSGLDWMEPFSLSLGINNQAFTDWKDILFRDTNALLLVEGETDKEYFELLRDEKHSNNRLKFEGDIFVYGGSGFFSNTVLLKFLLNRFSRVFITFDLDVESKVSKTLNSLGLKLKIDYLPIGKNKSGKTDIEGLLPNKISSIVFSENPDLADAAVGRGDGNKDARQKLKKLKLDKFKEISKVGEEYYKDFYLISHIINKAFKV